MYFTRQANGFRAWFAVVVSGLPRVGIIAGKFTITIVDPADAANDAPVVAESAQKPGLYTFLIPSAFVLANGTGEYGVVIEVVENVPPRITDTFSEVLKVSQEDFDSLGESITSEEATVIAGSSTVEIRTDLAQADDFFNGMYIQVANAAGVVVRQIDQYLQANGACTITDPLPFTPQVGDVVRISNYNKNPNTGVR